MMLKPIDGPRAGAKPGEADALMILAHGYGADGNDLIGLAQAFQRRLPRAAFASPHAPEPCDAGLGFQWFPLTRMDFDEMLRGVIGAAPAFERFIDGELERYRLPASRLILAGFSQGTMMALHVGLRRAEPPAAIIGFSGALPGAERLKDEIVGRPPVLLTHGDSDEVIPPAAMLMAANGLAAAGVPVRWRMSPRIGHGVGPDALDLAVAFAGDALRARAT